MPETFNPPQHRVRIFSFTIKIVLHQKAEAHKSMYCYDTAHTRACIYLHKIPPRKTSLLYDINSCPRIFIHFMRKLSFPCEVGTWNTMKTLCHYIRLDDISRLFFSVLACFIFVGSQITVSKVRKWPAYSSISYHLLFLINTYPWKTTLAPSPWDFIQ